MLPSSLALSENACNQPADGHGFCISSALFPSIIMLDAVVQMKYVEIRCETINPLRKRFPEFVFRIEFFLVWKVCKA